MYIKRDISQSLRNGAQDSPVIAIIGPRQSGKSTLCKELFPRHKYVDLQDIDNLSFAKNDPKGFLESNDNEHGIIIDEAQYAPNLFPQIKVEVDKKRDIHGRYILSGSQNFLLNEKITESLAGRVYIYKLLPLSIHELINSEMLLHDLNSQMLKGFYPGLYSTSKMIDKFYESYFHTYVERDLRAIRSIDNLALFEKFIKLCSYRIGTPLNLTSLANDAGISVATARSWLSLLEASFIVFTLPSYHNNLSKRIIKSPKLYFYDVGLALNISGFSLQSLKDNRQMAGGFFENMIIVDFLKNSWNFGNRLNLSFFRDTNLKEVDLILEKDDLKIPVEIKLSKSIQDSFFVNIDWFKSEINCDRGALVYSGDQIQKRSNGNIVLPWNHAYKLI